MRILLEGIDGAGKTTLINSLKELYPQALIVKGYNRERGIDRFINAHPRDLPIWILMLWRNLQIKKETKLVLLDRSYPTELCYTPNCYHLGARFWARMLTPHFLPNELLVWLDVDIEVAVQRLKLKVRHEEEAYLIDHKEVLIERRELYSKFFTSYQGEKLRLNGNLPTQELVIILKEWLEIREL